MQVPVNAKVLCKDGLWGYSTCIILDPINKCVTHFVASEINGDQQRLIPLEIIETVDHNEIKINCAKAAMVQFRSFVDKHFSRKEIPQYDLPGDNELYLEWPLVTYKDVVETTEKVPVGELAFHRGAEIHATDGPIGQVGEFVVDDTGQHISHIVLDENHLWGTRHILIPVDWIESIHTDQITLNMSKQQIHSKNN